MINNKINKLLLIYYPRTIKTRGENNFKEFEASEIKKEESQ